jgi:cell wall-associated NlpC family hydrolase
MSHFSRTCGRLPAIVLVASLLGVARSADAQRQSTLPDLRVLALSQQPKPFASFSLVALTQRDSLVALARAQVGKRYRLGGTTPDRGFDCSGLVKYVLAAFRVEVPRTSREQSHAGAAIPRDRRQLRPGDLLLFGRPKDGVSHVGIYVGNGRYIHASSMAGRVIESPLDRKPSPSIKAFKSARRVLAPEERISLLAIRSQ